MAWADAAGIKIVVILGSAIRVPAIVRPLVIYCLTALLILTTGDPPDDCGVKMTDGRTGEHAG